MRWTTMIRGAWGSLAVAFLIALAPAPAAGQCTYEFGDASATHGWLPAEYEPIDEDSLICGSDRDPNYVHTMRGGAFEGGGGYDRVIYMYGGSFRGGDEGDHLLYMFGGAFEGDDDRDVVVSMSSGSFDGGAGDDHVFDLHGGTFDGGDGDDRVTIMYGGTFDGGAGQDIVYVYEGGTCVNVESANGCPAP